MEVPLKALEGLDDHSFVIEVAYVMGYTAMLWVAHGFLHEGGLALMLAPELMKPLLQDMPPKSQKKDSRDDVAKYVILSNKASNVNVKLHTTCQVRLSSFAQQEDCVHTGVQ